MEENLGRVAPAGSTHERGEVGGCRCVAGRWSVSGQWGTAKQPRNLGGPVFSTLGETARVPHKKSSGSSGSASGLGGTKGRKRGTAERRERSEAGGETRGLHSRSLCPRKRVAGVGVGGEYRRSRGTCPKGLGGGKRPPGRCSLRRDRWREHRAKNPSEHNDAR